jgi:Zn finger protein HypA/HybF involved in hydrogenase expression
MVISLLTLHECIRTLHSEKGGTHVSILYEMPCKKGNEGCLNHNHENSKQATQGVCPVCGTKMFCIGRTYKLPVMHTYRYRSLGSKR